MTLRTADQEVPPGAGNPRLVKSLDGHATAGTPQAEGIENVHRLDQDLTTIGSAMSQDIIVPDIDPAHGVIRREPAGDEYVYEQLSHGAISRVDGAIVTVADLHHGDRLTLGSSTYIFQRDEFADHGRYDGGREGGESSGPTGAGTGGHEGEPGTRGNDE